MRCTSEILPVGDSYLFSHFFKWGQDLCNTRNKLVPPLLGLARSAPLSRPDSDPWPPWRRFLRFRLAGAADRLPEGQILEEQPGGRRPCRGSSVPPGEWP